MIEEAVRKGSTPRGSSRSVRGTAGLCSLGTRPTSVRADPQGQEGREFLDLLHEAAVTTVERRYTRGEVIFGEGDPGNAL